MKGDVCGFCCSCFQIVLNPVFNHALFKVRCASNPLHLYLCEFNFTAVRDIVDM